ncbi:MAG TPA: hypothetical protein VKH44_14500 [Pirellulaceae bacterium]|nr:hypothetical protein [Pirellulaceae bacterium]
MNPSAEKPKLRRPRFQFSLLGLMVLMLVAAAAAAPGYYLMHGGAELPQARLVGMLMMLAGPLLLMTLLSVFLSLMRRGR